MEVTLREFEGAGRIKLEPRTVKDRTSMTTADQAPTFRIINGVTVIGPDLFAKDEEGHSLSPIATAFPRYRAIVTGRGIHAMQVETFLDFLQRKKAEAGESLDPEEEREVLEDAVALLIRNGKVLLRSDPSRMEKVFKADELLRRLVPKNAIQFTGARIPEVRKALRRRGESWRITPAPRNQEEMCRFIEASRVSVGTSIVYYHNAPSGGRFLTYQEFMKIRHLLRKDPKQALCCLNEILDLTELVNDQGAREVSFFLPAGKELDTSPLRAAAEQLRSESGSLQKAIEYFDQFARSFAEAAGPDLVVDEITSPAWRKTMYCRLSDIEEEAVEEWSLGLSSEFFLNVKWLPGATITSEGICFEEQCEPRVRHLIEYYLQKWEGLQSINIGRVASPQASRERAGGERRDVYLVVLGFAEDREELRIVRMIKWDVTHRLDRGMPLNQAIEETLRYREYIFDRLKATELLGIEVPKYNTIELMENREGVGWIPVIYFDRKYFPGIATDKIPTAFYGDPEFIIRLTPLLGRAACLSVILGRANPSTYHVFFDDGDEIIQLNDRRLPYKVLLADTTGSFTDWTSPSQKLLDHCFEHVAEHLGKARVQGVPPSCLSLAVERLAEGLACELERLKENLKRGALERIQAEFGHRSCEPGGIRSRVEGVLKRVMESDPAEFREAVFKSPHFKPFLQF